MHSLLRGYFRSVLPPYSRKDLPAIFGTLGLILIVSFALNSFSKETVIPSHAQFAGTTYYLDCNGNDANTGTSEASAWKTITKANAATLNPGDKLLLKRDCSWSGTLYAVRNGTGENPIVYGAYGTGSNPHITGGFDQPSGVYMAVKISGSYQIIENFDVDNPEPTNRTGADIGCVYNGAPGWPTGWRVGFNLAGTNNMVQHSTATKSVAGINFSATGSNNKAFYNKLYNNFLMSVNDPGGNGNDSGAWGITVHGNGHEIAYNELWDNNAFCSYDFQSPSFPTGAEGASVEVFQANNNKIHHNYAHEDRTFTELGTNDSNNEFYYNVIVATQYPSSEAFNLRGNGNIVRHNSVYYTGSGSKGIVTNSQPTTPHTIQDNIIWASTNYFPGATEERNIFWASSGAPITNPSTINSTSQKSNPFFVDPNAYDLALQSTSPAITGGILNAGTLDFDNMLVPAPNGAISRGAFQYGSIPANQPTPTVIPNTPTASPTAAITNTPVPPTPTRTPTPTPGDTTLPTVSITSPTNGSKVARGSTITMAASASDTGSGIKKVEFYVNGSLMATDTTTPYAASYVLGKQKNVQYRIQAKAYDNANNQASSSLVTITSI